MFKLSSEALKAYNRSSCPKKKQYKELQQLYKKHCALGGGTLTARGAMLAALAAKENGAENEEILKIMLKGFDTDAERASSKIKMATCCEQLGEDFASVFYKKGASIEGIPSLQSGTQELYALASSSQSEIGQSLKEEIEKRHKKHPALQLLAE